MAAVRETTLYARRSERAPIMLAIVASVVIHALIFVLFPGLSQILKPVRSDPAPIVARLLETPPVATTPATEEVPVPMPQVNVPEHELAPPPASRPVPAPAPAARPTVEPRARIAPAAPSSVLPADPARAVESAQSATAEVRPAPSLGSDPVAPAPAPTPRAGPPATDAADPATLGQYRIALITAARRYKKYPRIAIDNNWEGRAEVRLVIDASGAIASLSIKTGSGYEVLDKQALEMIRKAKPSATIPPALRGKGFTLDLPVLFSLSEEAG